MRIRIALLAATALAGFGSMALAQETTTTWRGAPQFANDTLTFKVRGRVYQDLVMQEVDNENPASLDVETRETRLRTARIGVEGTWNGNWGYKAEINFNGRSGGASSGEAEWEDLLLEYKPDDTTSIMLGNFRTVSLEALTSSRYNAFMERGPFNDIIDGGRFMSLQAKSNGVNWTASVALVGASVNGPDTASTTVNGQTEAKEPLGYTTRFTYMPIDTDTDKVHLGLWTRQRDRGTAGAFTYQARPNTNYGARYVSSTGIGERDNTIAGEFAWVHQNFSVQSEYANISVDRLNNPGAPDIKVGYLFATWAPTGESRRYEGNRGEFNRTRVLNPVTAGGWGGLELGLRYDFADLSDVIGVATAGEYTGMTLGATWMPFTYARFQANYTKGENKIPGANNDIDADTLQFRAQFDF